MGTTTLTKNENHKVTKITKNFFVIFVFFVVHLYGSSQWFQSSNKSSIASATSPTLPSNK